MTGAEIFVLLECYAAQICSYRRFETTYRSRIQGSYCLTVTGFINFCSSRVRQEGARSLERISFWSLTPKICGPSELGIVSCQPSSAQDFNVTSTSLENLQVAVSKTAMNPATTLGLEFQLFRWTESCMHISKYNDTDGRLPQHWGISLQLTL